MGARTYRELSRRGAIEIIARHTTQRAAEKSRRTRGWLAVADRGRARTGEMKTKNEFDSTGANKNSLPVRWQRQLTLRYVTFPPQG